MGSEIGDRTELQAFRSSPVAYFLTLLVLFKVQRSIGRLIGTKDLSTIIAKAEALQIRFWIGMLNYDVQLDRKGSNIKEPARHNKPYV